MNNAIEALSIGITLTMIFLFLSPFSPSFAIYATRKPSPWPKEVCCAPRRSRNGRGTLRWGIVLAFVGFALVLGLLPIGFYIDSANTPLLGPWLLARLPAHVLWPGLDDHILRDPW